MQADISASNSSNIKVPNSVLEPNDTLNRTE